METSCSLKLNLATWTSRLYRLGIFLLLFLLCWREAKTFQTSERITRRYADTVSNLIPQRSELNDRFIVAGNFTNRDPRAALQFDHTSSPTTTSSSIIANTTITAIVPTYGGFTEAIQNYTTETSFVTNHGGAYGPTCPNSTDWYLFNNSCYYFSGEASDSRRSWKEADSYCMNNGGYLVSIHGTDEHEFMKNFAVQYDVDSYWIGLREYETSGEYEWSDGTSVDFQMWAVGEPNDYNGEEECAQFYARDGTWNDLNCGDRIPFICKKAYGNMDPIVPAPTQMPAGNCHGSSVRFSNKCYWLNGTNEENRLTWQEARTKCVEYGTAMGMKVTLAIIHSQEIQSFLKSQLKGLDHHRLWIGLSDITNNNQFRWCDGTALDYTNWGSGEPSESDRKEDCVEMMSDEDRLGDWNDISCTKLNGYICEHIPSTIAPEPDPITNDCRAGYTQYYESCFRVMSPASTFSAAIGVCNRDGTNLATISNVYEQAYVETLLHSSGGEALWIGLMDNSTIAGPYSWFDGWPVWYTNWGVSEPSRRVGEGCVAVKYNGDWDDTMCDFEYKPLCKYSLDTPTEPLESAGTCEGGWAAFGSACYQYNYGEDLMTSWPEAEFYCNKVGAYIASVHSKQDNEWIRTQLASSSTEDIWIGLHRTHSSGFVWQDETSVEYTNWGPNEPTYTWDGEHENCVEMYIDNGLWNDNDCLQRQSYVCKKPKTPVGIERSTTTTTPQGVPTLSGTLPSKQSAQPQSDDLMSLGGVIGIFLTTVILILTAGVIIFFVATRSSSAKVPLNIGCIGFDNALYSAANGTVKMTEKKNDPVADPPDAVDVF